MPHGDSLPTLLRETPFALSSSVAERRDSNPRLACTYAAFRVRVHKADQLPFDAIRSPARRLGRLPTQDEHAAWNTTHLIRLNEIQLKAFRLACLVAQICCIDAFDRASIAKHYPKLYAHSFSRVGGSSPSGERGRCVSSLRRPGQPARCMAYACLLRFVIWKQRRTWPWPVGNHRASGACILQQSQIHR